MSRCRSTDSDGKPFDETIIQAVWQKAPISKKCPPLRVDCRGALMFEHSYGVTGSKFGWEIDHHTPVAKGGGDDLQNLQPLQWLNNRTKGDQLPE
jgi:5-methylcytosine-specific restriction endonuclease McrA